MCCKGMCFCLVSQMKYLRFAIKCVSFKEVGGGNEYNICKYEYHVGVVKEN